MPAPARRYHLIAACLLTIFALVAPASAQVDLTGRQVLLIVTENRDDRNGEWLELSLRSIRHELGLAAQDLPVVRMGFSDRDADPKHFERLQLTKEDAPLLALVEWSSPDIEGPKRVIDRRILTRVYPEQGLDEPKRLLGHWLRSQGRDRLAEELLESDAGEGEGDRELPPDTEPPPDAEPPEPTPSATPEPPPDPALKAFDQRRYAEAIVLARERQDAPLEERAKEAFRQQAVLALAEGRRPLALSVYTQLSVLYPEETFFSERVKELSNPPEKIILGRWKIVSGLGWAEFRAKPDGKLKGKAGGWLLPLTTKWEGRWELTGARERTFRLHWKTGNIHDVTISEDGSAMTGTGLHEGEVKGERLED